MWLKDPKTNEASVSLTLLAASFILLVIASVANIMGKVESTASLLELFYACAGLYFGRRFSFKGGSGASTVGKE